MADNEVSDLTQSLEAIAVQDLPTVATDEIEAAPHRSHDPATSAKRNDPFQFGQRYLEKEDNVFEFNAWDHVQQDEEYKEYAEALIAKQREAPVSDFDRGRFNSDPQKWWNKFYKNNTSNFFKDRKWLQQEFPILSQIIQEDAGPVTLLEIGCGTGSTAYPVLAANKNPQLKLHACDYSKTAVELVRKNEAYISNQIQSDVWDVAEKDTLPPGLAEGSVDIVTMIFIFSALNPNQWKAAVDNVYRVLKPGGELLFRDYARGDLAMVRFKKGRYMQENFYVRGDGTRVYFFEQQELEDIWTKDTHFTVENLAVDNRLLVNRGKQLKMFRSWIQGRFRKSETSSEAPSVE